MHTHTSITLAGTNCAYESRRKKKAAKQMIPDMIESTGRIVASPHFNCVCMCVCVCVCVYMCVYIYLHIYTEFCVCLCFVCMCMSPDMIDSTGRIVASCVCLS